MRTGGDAVSKASAQRFLPKLSRISIHTGMLAYGHPLQRSNF
jgi:hypothetical protein